MAKKTADKLRGISRLATEATLGITELVEAMHRRVVHPPLLPSTPIQHLITRIAGVTYKLIKRSTKTIGSGLDKALGHLGPLLGELKSSPEREALTAALNGVLGDYLEETENPLQITMQLRHQGKPLVLERLALKDAFPTLQGKILVLVHGSCLNDLQWTRQGHNHGTALAVALGYTPVYLHYNSGRPISSNGQDFSQLLDTLVQQWPVPVEEIVVLAHSMGGLVSRSAVYYGQQRQQGWAKHLKQMIFLGTPHHGAPLERAGSYLDLVLETIPYTKPFARLGKIRSAGVTDLRYGNITEEDRLPANPSAIRGDQRRVIPLPENVACYSIAAVRGAANAKSSSRGRGDGLVNIKSALGQHRDPAKHLAFPDTHTWIAYGTSHVDLLSDPSVYAKLKSWLEST